MAIGREGNAAVEEHLEVWPNLVDGFRARQLQHAHQHTHHPRRYATQVRNVLVNGLAGYLLTLLLEVAHQRSLLLWHAQQAGNGVYVLNQNRTEVAHQRVSNIVVRLMAATKNEALAIEHTALRIVLQIVSHRIDATTIVDALQALASHGDELRLVVGGATRLRIPRHLPGPQHVLLAVAHAVDPRSQLLIGGLWNEFCKIVVRVYTREVVLPPVLGICALCQQPFEHLPLQLLTVGEMALQFFLSGQ